jgi:hypothetical protein
MYLKMSLVKNFLLKFSQTAVGENHPNPCIWNLCIRSKWQVGKEWSEGNLEICEKNVQLYFSGGRTTRGILRAEIQSIQFMFVYLAVMEIWLKVPGKVSSQHSLLSWAVLGNEGVGILWSGKWCCEGTGWHPR